MAQEKEVGKDKDKRDNHEVRHPVLFYEITNVECVFSSNTTVFIGRI